MRRDLSWKELCDRAWGKDLKKPDIAYEFTNRTFYDRGTELSGDGIADAAAQSLYADDYADDYA
jgi:hypothetical protein